MTNHWDIESVLEQSLSQIAAGKARVESCLLSYPAMAEELRPLLQSAERLRALPKPDLSPAAKARIEEQLLAAAAADPRLAPAGGRRRGFVLPRPKFGLLRRRWALSALAAVLVLAIFLATVLAGVSGDALPGSPLYAVKLAVEDVQLWLAPARAEPALHLRFAARRLAEMEALLAQGTYDSSLEADLDFHLEAALAGIADLPPALAVPLLEELAALSDRQGETLRRVAARVPGVSLAELERAIGLAMARAALAQALLGELQPELPQAETDTPPAPTATTAPRAVTATPPPTGQVDTEEPAEAAGTPSSGDTEAEPADKGDKDDTEGPPAWGLTRTPDPDKPKTPPPALGLTKTPEPGSGDKEPKPPKPPKPDDKSKGETEAPAPADAALSGDAPAPDQPAGDAAAPSPPDSSKPEKQPKGP